MSMTIDKAIEIIQLNLKEAGPKMPPDVQEALKLAILSMEHFKKASSPEALEQLFNRVKSSPYTRPPKE